MDATAINAPREVLANVQTHPCLRLQLIISIQLHFTTDSLSLDPTNTYLRAIPRLMYIGSTLHKASLAT